MPVTEHLVHFCSDLYGQDFRRQGPGLNELGLSDPEELMRASRDGF